MNIRTVTIAELDDFIQSEEYHSFLTKPISPERALSQAKNPHAKPNDPALWLALTDDNILLGFIGSMPAMDYRTGQRIAWNSCWWVDPVKGKDAGMLLFYTFLKEWDMKVAFSDMTANTFSIVNQMGFCHTREEDICIGHIRLSFSEAFLSQKRLPYPLAPLFAFIIPVINLFQLIRVSTIRSNLREMEMEVRDQADQEMIDFIRQHQDEEFSQRNEKDFEWVQSQKWLARSNNEVISLSDRYPFSYECDKFEWSWVLTRIGGEINSVMLISIRDHTLKVLYYYGKEPGFALFALKAIASKDRSVRKIVLTHPNLIKNISLLNSILILKRWKKRYTGISKKMLDTYPDDLLMQLGDGDAVFT